MKFEIKVGQEFELKLAIDEESEVKKESSTGSVVILVCFLLAVFGVVSALGYGIATGDFTPVKNIAITCFELIGGALN